MILPIALVPVALFNSRAMQSPIPQWAAGLRLEADARKVDRRPAVALAFRAAQPHLSLAMLLPEVNACKIFTGRLGEALPTSFAKNAATEPNKKTRTTNYMIVSESRFQITTYTADRKKITTGMSDFYVDRPEIVRVDLKRDVALLKTRLGHPVEIQAGDQAGAFRLIWRWSGGAILFLSYSPGEKDGPSYMKALEF